MDADAEAWAMLLWGTDMSRAEVMVRGTEFVAPEVMSAIMGVLERRLGGEPLDHIFGVREFYGRQFKVSADVLSPREDTEVLVRRALAALESVEAPRVLDLGTGSGAIIVSVLAEREDARGVAVDLSEAALAIAGENARAHGVAERLDLLAGSWFAPVEGAFDLIVSNPPYITAQAMSVLEPEVADYDPALALAGGQDGLEAYRAILAEAGTYLLSSRHLVVEIGFDQGGAVCAMFEGAGFVDVSVMQDLAGLDRAVIGLKPT